jgi:heme exporter protein B
MSAFLALLSRDVRLAWRAGGVGVALGFFATVAVLLPLGVGPDLPLLMRIGGGVLWMAAMLAALLSLETLFLADFEDGSLDLIALSPLSLEAAVSAKIAAHWLSTGLPLALIALPAAAMFALPAAAAGMLAATLLIGTAAVSALGACGAALTLPLRRGGLLLPLIVLPLLSPAVIFGAAAVLAALDGVRSGAFLLLAAFSLAALALSPFAAAAAIRVHLAE